MSARPANRVPACLLAALLGCGLAACGGGGGPSKASFIKQADAICAKGSRDAAALPRPNLSGSKGSQVAALAAYLQSLVPILQRTSAQIRALKSPSQDRSLLQRYLTATDEQITQAQKLAAALRANDAQGVAAARTSLTGSTAATMASQYGFHSCSAATKTG